ncbi:MAG TPA: sugar transferase [Planctomycetota bacterium]|jgi:Undecaprenyl-phosphate galactose phosphotransferase WbaP
MLQTLSHSDALMRTTLVLRRLSRPALSSKEKYWRIKRAIDLACVIIGGIVIVPFCALIALAIKLDSRGPVFYRHERFGRSRRRFRVLKFRTMATNGDEILKRTLAQDPVLRAEWERDQKLRDDPRVTRVGRLLRITSLDELPQLWNVFVGEMSLVGPRPIVANEFKKYGAKLDTYTQVTPGITGLWQVSGRNNTTYEQRVQFDCQYVATRSITLDLAILLRTVKVVLFREGAY